MLSLIYTCKVCGKEHQVPTDWRDRRVEPPEELSARVDEKMVKLECLQRDSSALYMLGDIRWGKRTY